MAQRGATAAVQTEWAKAANEPAHLVEVRFDAGDGGTVYLTDSWRNVTWPANGKTYFAQGHLLGFNGLIESADMQITDVTMQLSGVDQTWISIILGKQYIDRRLLIYKMFFNQSTEQLIVDPFVLHDGRMDEPSIDEDPGSGKCVVTIKSRDVFADFERLAGRHTCPNDQNLFFPSDRAFDMNAQLVGQRLQLMWGNSPRENTATNPIDRLASGIAGTIDNFMGKFF